jgi:hypothetical protein
MPGVARAFSRSGRKASDRRDPARSAKAGGTRKAGEIPEEPKP